RRFAPAIHIQFILSESCKQTPRSTSATPGGARFTVRPERNDTDAQKEEENPNRSSFSNRLGGSDLRFLRDNYEAMGDVYANRGSKKAVPTNNSAMTPTYTASKRISAKKSMQSLVDDLAAVTDVQAKDDGGMARLLVFFRQDADRRAEADAKRRHEDREERDAAERREGEVRDRERREEAKAAEERHQQERKEDRERREEDAKREAALRAERERERAEERRQQDQQMQLEREELRQRHEQMMLMLQALAKSNNAK
ncbi:hypothetical protein L915_04120, partial [Phytophthora nicotianae]